MSRTSGPGHRLESSHPLVENHLPVGWAVRPAKMPRWKVEPAQPLTTSAEQTLGSYGTKHRHEFDVPAVMQPLVTRSFASEPAEVTVYAVCSRLVTIQFAKPRKPAGGTKRNS